MLRGAVLRGWCIEVRGMVGNGLGFREIEAKASWIRSVIGGGGVGVGVGACERGDQGSLE